MIIIKSRPYLANVGDSWGVNATFVRCLAGNAGFRIEGYSAGEKVLDFDGFAAGLSVGNLLRDATDPNSFQRMDSFVVTNGATPQTITLAYGDGDVADNRLVGLINISGALYSKPFAADTLVLQSGLTVMGTANPVTIVKASQGAELTIQNVGSNLLMYAYNTVTAGNAQYLEGISGSANAGGAVTLSAGIDVQLISPLTTFVRVSQTKFA